MRIYVKTLTGKQIELVVDPSDTILSIKKRIEEKEGIPSYCQLLVFAGRQVHNAEVDDAGCTIPRTLSCYEGVLRNSKLNLVRLRYGKRSVQLHIVMPDGAVVPFTAEVRNDWKSGYPSAVLVTDLKQQLESKFNIPAQLLRLSLEEEQGCRPLGQDDQPLDECGVATVGRSRIHVAVAKMAKKAVAAGGGGGSSERGVAAGGSGAAGASLLCQALEEAEKADQAEADGGKT